MMSVRDIGVVGAGTMGSGIAEVAAVAAHPERVVGMHFFNPVALLPLIELVRATETDDATLATAWDVAEKLRVRVWLVAPEQLVEDAEAALERHGAANGTKTFGRAA